MSEDKNNNNIDEEVNKASEAVEEASDAVNEACENIDKSVKQASETINDASETINQTKESTESKSEKKPAISNEVITRIFVTLLFALIGWLSLWVFGVVVLVQFGFLLITGQLNSNLKAFNGELGEFLADIIKYVSFHTDDKPFPFQSWSYGDTTESTESEAKSS